MLVVGDRLRRSFAAVVERGGVGTQQYNVLRILRGAGKEGLPIRKIAARLIEKSPGITRFVDQLESRGLIRRQRSTQDRRKVFCTITKSGLRVLTELDRPVNEWEEWSLAMLNRRQLKQLICLLESICSFQSKVEGGQHDEPGSHRHGGRRSGRS